MGRGRKDAGCGEMRLGRVSVWGCEAGEGVGMWGEAGEGVGVWGEAGEGGEERGMKTEGWMC